jgi:2-(1,2-epoxy-1,2-dihydrophenyl)acetyl-CoA isomerase
MPLLTYLADGVLTLSLNRPEKLNAIDDAAALELLDALAQAQQSPAVRVVVLRGEGRAFCAGRDVSEPPTAAILERVQAVAAALVHNMQPVLVAVQGWVVGAGLEWMLDADIAIAARSARFSLPEASLGVFPTGGITALLPRTVGLVRAKGLLLLGESFDAAQAERWGLVWSVVDDAALGAETARIAQRLAAIEPRVAQRFKHALNLLGGDGFDRALALESALQTELMQPGPG